MNTKDYKKAVRSAFDEAAAGYDRPPMRFFDNAAAALVDGLSLQGNEDVLDAATGTGKVALALARRLPQGRVTGIDLSPGMLRRASAKARAARLKNVVFRRADVDAPGFPAGRFDGLTCGFGVHFWPDMRKTLSRLTRTVKPGGFVAATSFADGSFEPHAGFCLRRFARYGVKLPDSYSWERLDHPRKITALFRRVGLRKIVCARRQAGFYLRSARDWWDLVRFTGFRAFLNQLTPAQAARYKREFLDEVDRTRDKKGIFLNVEVITAVGTK